MIPFSLHLAPNAPWIALALASLALAALGIWAYRFVIPPLPPLARRLLPALRMIALLLLVWLLAQPVLERARAGGGTRVAVLLDRSRSMELPEERVAGTGRRETRSQAADRAVAEIDRAWRGRGVRIQTIPFAGRLGTDSSWTRTRGATAPGGALASLQQDAQGLELDGVVVVSDGAVNAGADPVEAARSLGVPVHAVVVGRPLGRDRAITEVQSSERARVGEATPVRVSVATSEERGQPIVVRLLDGARELGRATVIAPGGGAEATAEFRATPLRPGLAVWTAVVDSLAGEATTANNARQIAVDVAPGKLGVLVVSSGLNWDLAFVRRALLGDSSLTLRTVVRRPGDWQWIETPRRAGAPGPTDVRGPSVVILDGLSGLDVGPEFDAALAGFVRAGGGLLVLGGRPPGLLRFRSGRLGADLNFEAGGQVAGIGNPTPTPEARDLLAWDDDPARGERAWRAAAPLSDAAPLRAGAGDRVMLLGGGGETPLMLARRVGRGQALLVNGTGVWRWALSGHDDLTAERGRRLWRRVVRWLAEPVQAEPLRVRPERWLTARGEPVRLLASLQDPAFKPIAGATVEAEVRDAAGRPVTAPFVARGPGSYVATLEDLPPGRYRVVARATLRGREVGRGVTELAVDRWSLEEVRADPDSAGLAAMAAAGGGRVTPAAAAGRWARTLEMRSLARGRTASVRLWESPWVFAIVVAALALEWAWRRRRGLP